MIELSANSFIKKSKEPEINLEWPKLNKQRYIQELYNGLHKLLFFFLVFSTINWTLDIKIFIIAN